MTAILIPGGAGFLGSHLVDYCLKQTDWEVIVWDILNYASPDCGRLREIGAIGNLRFSFEQIDIAGKLPSVNVEYVAHIAAETHVDRSIDDAEPFIQSNVVGTYHMLELARSMGNLRKFLYFSTDEVYGPANGEPFQEWSRYNSSNPYSATKAAGEELALAWANTYNLPVVISHCCNIFGERQHPEKFIPKLVHAIREGRSIDIHYTEEGQSGSRMYVYAGEVVQWIALMLEHGAIREKYNITGPTITNEEMATLVSGIMGQNIYVNRCYPKERPGWDFSYSIGGENIHGLGQVTSEPFSVSLERAIEAKI